MTTAERMAKIETKLDYTVTSLDELRRELKEFINSADKKYATKEELANVKVNLKDHTDNSRGWIKSIVPWIISSVGAIIAILAIIFK